MKLFKKKNPPPPLQLHRAARDFIVEESTAKVPRETGGILIGRSDDKDLLVTQALGPGPKAHHGARSLSE